MIHSSIALTGVLTVSAVLASLGVHAIGFHQLHRSALASHSVLEGSLFARLKAPSRVTLPLLAFVIAVAELEMPLSLRSILLHIGGIGLIAAFTWAVTELTYVLEDVLLDHYRIDTQDNLKARRIHTQIQVLRRVTVVIVIVVAIGLVLLSFGKVRAAGAGLLASAGIIGIIGGVAAKPTATNVIAGLQIAISQPIRLDDVVVVDGQWGRVEEIALTYVVIRIWDLRRLVLPISYLIENPFENWTRSSSDILGWVFIEVDYSAPIGEIRSQFEQILRDSPEWDHHVAILQVTNCGPKTLQLRALMSSQDSALSWNLQCAVREKLVEFLQKEHPSALPRLRAELTNGPGQPHPNYDARSHVD